MKKIDVVIVGSGIAGITTAYYLQRDLMFLVNGSRLQSFIMTMSYVGI